MVIRNSNIPNSLINNDTLVDENSKIFNFKSPRNHNYNTRNSSIINITRSNTANKKNQIFAFNSNANIHHVRQGSNALNKHHRKNSNVLQSSNMENYRYSNNTNIANNQIFSPIHRNKNQNSNIFSKADKNGNFNKNNYYTTDFVNGITILNSEKNKKNITSQLQSNNLEFKNNMNNDISYIEDNSSFYSMNISNHINLDIDLNGYSLEDFNESIIFSKLHSHNLIKVIDDLNESNSINNYNAELNVEANLNNNNPKYKYLIISAIDLIPNLFNKNINSQFMFCPTAETKPFVIYDKYSIDKLNLKSEKKRQIIDLKEAAENILGLEELEKAETIEKYGFCGLNLKIFYNNYQNEILKDIDSQEKNSRIMDYFLNLSNLNIFLDEKFLKTFTNIKSEKFINTKNILDVEKTEIKGRSIMMYTIDSDLKLKYSLINPNIDELFNKQKENKLYLKKLSSNNINNNLKEKSLINVAKSDEFEKNEHFSSGEEFLNNVDFLNHFENFIRYLENLNNIESIKMLKNNFHRFGINSSLEIFALPKLKNSKIAEMIKINILVKLIKSYLNYDFGLNFIKKIFKQNILINEDPLINETTNGKGKGENKHFMKDEIFDFIKDKNLYDSFKIKIRFAILSILNPSLVNKQFLENFNKNLNFQYFIKNMKWRQLDNCIGFNLFENNSNDIHSSQMNNKFLFSKNEKSTQLKFSQTELLLNLIETAKNKPFLFLNIFEYHMKINIDPLIKFKSSFSKDNFTRYFTEIHFNENEPIAISYIKPKELSYYLLSKCIYASFSSSQYNYYGERLKLTKNQTESLNNFNKDTKPSSGITDNYMLKNEKMKEPPKNIIKNNLSKINPTKQLLTKNNNDYIENNRKIIYEGFNEVLNVENYYNNDIEKDIDFEQEGPILNNMYNENQHNSTKKSIPIPIIQNMSNIKNKIRINSNNITNLNSNHLKEDQSQYIDHSISNTFINDPRKSSIQKSMLLDLKSESLNNFGNSENIWNNLSREFDLNFPPVLYKLNYKKIREDFKNETINPTNEKFKKDVNNINKYLKSNYFFNKIDIIKDWKNSTEILFNDLVTNDNSESVKLTTLFIILIHHTFIDFDGNLSKEVLTKIKDTLRSFYHFRLEDLASINLIEAMIVEKKKYIESEEYITKCLIFSLFLFGDPRGRNNFGHPFMLYPLWKISRQTLILENSLTNENFKEIFHCQNNIFKNKVENNHTQNQINDLYDNTVIYHIENLLKKKIIYNKFLQMKLKNYKANNKIYTNINNINEDNYRENIAINLSGIILDENKTSEFDEYKNLYLNENNFSYFTKYKYFPFPSISDVKNSYQNYFQTEKFISFFFKNMIFLSESDILYDEEILNKLNLNFFSLMSSIEIFDNTNSHYDNFNNFNYKSATYSNICEKGSKKSKDKTTTLSPLLYDYLIEKMSFKRNLPYGVVLTWGNNSHNETSHDVYRKSFLHY